MNLFSLTAAAREAGERTALLIDGEPLTYAQINRRADEIQLEGAAPDRPIALVAIPRVEVLIHLYRCLEDGAPFLLLHPRSTRENRRLLASRVGATVLIDEGGIQPLEPTSRAPHPHADDQVLVPTSGTTGEPKLAVFGRHQLASAVMASAKNLPLNWDSKWLLSLPYSHVGGLSVILRALANRSTVVLESSRSLVSDGMERLADLGVTHLSMVPTQLHRLAQGQIAPPLSLQVALVGGAATPLGLRQRAHQLGWPAIYTYGLTEACSQVATQAFSELSRPLNDDSGRPLPGYQVRRGKNGTLAVQTPSLMTRYWGEPAFEPKAWFQTSDLGTIDSEGRITVTGRRDHLIISGGENVSPEQVEAVLHGAPEVRDCCVIGVADAEWGEQVIAVLVGNAERENEVWRVANEHLEPAMRPKVLHWTQELPVLENGKLDRRAVLSRVGALNDGS